MSNLKPSAVSNDPFAFTNEDRFRYQVFCEVANSLPVIAWTALPDGSLDYYNRHWFSYTGLNLEVTRGTGWVPVVHPDDLAACSRLWEESLGSGKVYEAELRLLRNDGAYRWHRAKGQAVRDSEGRHIKWFGITIDIEDQKRSTQTMQDGYESLCKNLQQRISELESMVKRPSQVI